MTCMKGCPINRVCIIVSYKKNAEWIKDVNKGKVVRQENIILRLIRQKLQNVSLFFDTSVSVP